MRRNKPAKRGSRLTHPMHRKTWGWYTFEFFLFDANGEPSGVPYTKDFPDTPKYPSAYSRHSLQIGARNLDEAIGYVRGYGHMLRVSFTDTAEFQDKNGTVYLGDSVEYPAEPMYDQLRSEPQVYAVIRPSELIPEID